MPPKRKKKKDNWANSKAKSILRQGILDGTIKLDVDELALYESNDEHKKWKFENWQSNLRNLRNAIARDRGRMARDARDFGHDKGQVRHLRQNDSTPVPWHKTACPKLLKKDIDEGQHLTMAPRELYITKPEYQQFPLSVFRKHIYQEIDCRPKREARFERKKQTWKYPELHTNHPRLQQNNA